ncbi:hypothetical protein HYN48_13485 [Flavobacterium magnum]|uniref:Uncharacterized protein n=1 Tax=Flavobacterium magnum TaxID=2162713 RepID=A0A2S0RJW9_9FLAO|nr:hypothetical protein [Flavobacterium magnum]AWA31012.1 hypothetical protein HYN48_13485 [Flavobacterium magnum]
MTKQTNDNWPAFDPKTWKTIPAFTGKIATESDAKTSKAVFCLKNLDETQHKAYKIELPKLAYLIDSENGDKELIVLIQAEETNRGIVVGYRNPKGGNGACFYYELQLLTENEVTALVK